MSTTEYCLQVLLESLRGLHPAKMNSEQLTRGLDAMRLAARHWEDELRLRELAEARRRELHLGEAA